MSLTLLSQPSTYLVSAGNDSVFVVSGSNALSANVFDYVYIANILVNGVVSVTQKVSPDTNFQYGVFNLKNIISSFLSYDFPFTDNTASIFTSGSNSSCLVQLQFGEQYTLGPNFSQSLNLITSSTYAYLNSSLTSVDQVNVNLNNYLVSNVTSSAINFLTTFTGSSTTYTNLRNHLYYFISQSVATLTYLSVQTFDSNNNQLGLYYIPNTLPSGTPQVQIVCTGYPILSKLVSGSATPSPGQYAVSSGNPVMFNSSVVSYNVQIVGNSFVPFSQVKNYMIADNTGRWQNYITNCYFLNDRGGFEAFQFQRKNQSSLKKTTSTFKKQPGTLQSNGQFIFNTYDRQTSNYFTQLNNIIECNTDWLSNAQCLTLIRNLFSSPVIYLEDINGVLQAANVNEKDYQILNSTIKKNNSVKFTFELSGNDYRQPL
jgi:hypothetical protein